MQKIAIVYIFNKISVLFLLVDSRLFLSYHSFIKFKLPVRSIVNLSNL